MLEGRCYRYEFMNINFARKQWQVLKDNNQYEIHPVTFGEYFYPIFKLSFCLAPFFLHTKFLMLDY
jgi:hypothetical protein